MGNPALDFETDILLSIYLYILCVGECVCVYQNLYIYVFYFYISLILFHSFSFTMCLTKQNGILILRKSSWYSLPSIGAVFCWSVIFVYLYRYLQVYSYIKSNNTYIIAQRDRE